MKRLLFLFSLHLLGQAGFSQEVLWADKVIEFSSDVNQISARLSYGVNQILGEPNVYPQSYVSPCAWTPNGSDFGQDYIMVGFPKAIVPKSVGIAESFNPGGIVRIFGYTEAGEELLLHENTSSKPRTMGRLWLVPVETNGKAINAVKLLIDHLSAKGIKQIDAVGICNEKSFKVEINIAENLPEDLQKINLGPMVNSTFGEVAPLISADGKNLFFTRIKHPGNIKDPQDKENIRQDIWQSVMDSQGNWTAAKNLGEPINNKDDNAATSVSGKGKSLFILNVYGKNTMTTGLSRTNFVNGTWTYPKKVEIDYFQALQNEPVPTIINQRSNTSNDIRIEFTVSHDEKVLIMGLRRDVSYGSKDLYVSFQKEDGSYSMPVNLGPIINTAADEGSPFISIDKKTLYFNSRGHRGYGDADIFMSQRLDSTWTKWSTPKNLGPSINSPSWDGYFSIPASGDYAYLSSRENSLGQEDIFKLTLFKSIRPNPVVLVKYQVKNALTEELLNIPPRFTCNVDSLRMEEISWNFNEQEKEWEAFFPVNAIFKMDFNEDGYLQKTETIDLSREENYKEIHRVIPLTPITAGQKMVLEYVTFDQGKFDLRDTSIAELEKIVALMKKYPDMHILLEGHTDNQGDFTLNVELAKNRVQAVKKYLVNQGRIAASRIETKSWGPLKPIASNSTPETREKNRRVEFTIVKM